MIITVTANPSLDRTIEVDRLRRGEVQRAGGNRVDAGGKGVNVSRALVANGLATRAVLSAGGHAGDELVGLLRAAAVPIVEVRVAEPIRSNLTVAEADGTVTKLNEAGPRLSEAEVEALLDATAAATTTLASRKSAQRAAWIAGCGSLPPGVGDDFYSRLVERARTAGAKSAVDTSGTALEACLAAGPDLVKPNHEELAAAAGVPITTLGDAVKAAEVLRGRGAGAVLASLGADGALLLDATGVHHAVAAPSGHVASTVGAGDAALAGFLAVGGRGAAALRTAVAWGTAAVTLPGSRMPGPGDIDPDTVETTPYPDLDRVLSH
ncbi:1-phosphofructokinase family hexose kinase [Glycomyces sp. L485]|uniref:1-phosphofructokinase family hexose kinase n=1 Tax=Glycomyces sp. L485 TaxID=2909235 RepID=UPI001F4A1437|nr:1-phosphofructokinase family hexose kinase [Glycomyces sp. L485]